MNLPKSCESSNAIIIDIPHAGTKKTFNKVRSSPHEQNTNHNNSHDAYVVDSFGYWYGEDANNRSTFNYVQDDMGNVLGSLIDVADHTIFQFQIEDGIPSVIITDSAEFPDELDPVQPPLPDHERKLLDNTSISIASSSKSSSATSMSHSTIKRDTISKSNLRLKSSSSRSLFDDSGGNLDVMVVWDRDAECRNSGLSTSCTLTEETARNMRARIELAIQETNTAYAQSGVNTVLNLVHSYKHPTYVATGFSSALNDITSNQVQGVHAERDTYGADLVALIIDDPQYCGIAWLGPREDLMYSVTAWNCATGYFSFGHEIGHNLGLNHDRGTSGACGNSNYNYGYRDPSADFRSILAYSCNSGQCDNNQGGGCTRVQRFSNPNSLYNGKPIGTATEDNARKINDVKATVAAYRTTVSSTESPVTSPTEPPVTPPIEPPVTPPTEPPVTPPTEPPVTPPTEPPVTPPTEPPVTPPSEPPVTPPTEPPVASPTSCSDRTGTFKFRNNNNFSCQRASANKTRFCKINQIKKKCPVTCNRCNVINCENRNGKFWIRGQRKNWCNWAKRGNSEQRCNGFNGSVSKNCPGSCNPGCTASS